MTPGECVGASEEVPGELDAGFAAHVRLRPDESDLAHDYASDDEEEAEDFLKQWCGKGSAVRVSLPRHWAAELVEKRWTDIQALASELLVHRTLRGEEAELIVRRNRGDPDAAAALNDLR